MNDLAMFASRRGIEAAARESALRLTEAEVRQLAEVEADCLAELRRVSFGEGAAPRLVKELATSPYLVGEAAGVLAELTGAFYELREELPGSVTDREIIESLQVAFDGDGAGHVGLASSLARQELAAQANGIL